METGERKIVRVGGDDLIPDVDPVHSRVPFLPHRDSDLAVVDLVGEDIVSPTSHLST